MTAKAASAHNFDKNASDPGCLEARAGEMAVAICAAVGRGFDSRVEHINAGLSAHSLSCMLKW